MRSSLVRLIGFGVPALMFLGIGCRTTFAPVPGAVPLVTIVDDEGDVVTGIRQKHVIGTSACPTQMAPVRIEVKGDEHPPVALPKTNVKWLKLPDEVRPGEWFIPLFNCDIEDFTTHVEEADVTFDWKEDVGKPEDAPSAPQGVDIGTYKKSGLKLKARTEICKSFASCPPEAGVEDASSKEHGIDTVTWAKPCATDSQCAPASSDKGWYGTAPDDVPKAE